MTIRRLRSRAARALVKLAVHVDGDPTVQGTLTYTVPRPPEREP